MLDRTGVRLSPNRPASQSSDGRESGAVAARRYLRILAVAVPQAGEQRRREACVSKSWRDVAGAWRRSGPPLADERGHAPGWRHETGTGTHASGQLATLG